MTELVKEGRAAEVKDRERAELFGVLIASPGWTAYSEVLNKMIEDRGSEILAPARSVDGAIALEHVKGAMYGLILARDLPFATIEAMKQLAASHPAQEEETDE